MIPLNDFRRQWVDTAEDATAAFRAVGGSGWYILGEEVRQFEAALATLWNRKHCVGVASGLDALTIALLVLGCRPGDRVLTTPVSAFATTLAILKLDAIPVFVDVDERGAMDLEQCARVLSQRADVRFMMPVHLYGHPLDASALAEIQTRFECHIIEDCAQSILATLNGKATGAIGEVAATSFYPTKNLGAFGDGGAVLTDDDAVAVAARALRDYGQTGKYRHDHVGFNSRLDELQASLMRRAFLPRLAKWTQRRRELARRYLDGIRHSHVTVPPPSPGSEPCWHLFPILVPAQQKEPFLGHLLANGIGPGEHYPIAIPDQGAMRDVVWEADGELSRARSFCASEVTLPIHPYLRDEEVTHIIDVVNGWPS